MPGDFCSGHWAASPTSGAAQQVRFPFRYLEVGEAFYAPALQTYMRSRAAFAEEHNAYVRHVRERRS